jgi:uncharacterized protein YfdQ (DUF2303 family)
MPPETIEIDDSAIKRLSAMAISAQSIQKHGDTVHLVVPEGYKHIDITDAVEKAQDYPNRKRGTVQLRDISSFVRYAQEQGMIDHGYIYADPESRTLTAVLNDQRHIDYPGWRDFRAVYTAELSREFSTWIASNKKPMEQEEFAVFLEDNIADVVEPSGDTLLTIALTLQAKTEVNFSSSRRLDNGQVQLAYTENIDARAGSGSIEIPREFHIGLRLFKNGDGYKVRARLKYRLGAGKVKFWYELDRPENAIEDAFTAYTAKASESGYAVLIGKP